MRLFSQNVKVEALKRAPLFEGLSKKELTTLAAASDDLEVEAGTVLCREGRIGHEFFVIVDGEADVTKGGKRVATRSGGDFVGEIALLSTTKRTATVTATTPLRCFVLTRVGVPARPRGEPVGAAQGAAGPRGAARRRQRRLGR